MTTDPIMKITKENLSEFSSDVETLHTTPITVLQDIPSPISFLREYVALSKPVLIKNAFPKISLDDLVRGNDALILHVDVSPDGHADTIRVVDGEKAFVMPQTREMKFLAFVEGLRIQQKRQKNDVLDCDENGLKKVNYQTNEPQIEEPNHMDEEEDVLYYSRQNDCLRCELPELMDYFPPSIPFVDEALDLKPDAINLWIGNERSVSSMHKDHYENIMGVALGEKIFTVCPPSDALYLRESDISSGSFQKDSNGKWIVVKDIIQDDQGQKVRWMESNVEKLLPPSSSDEINKCIEHNPLLKYAHPMRIRVSEGDLLYLPSLWYHRVTQTKETVAVNYWYDMRFDSPQWCAFNLYQHIKK